MSDQATPEVKGRDIRKRRSLVGQAAYQLLGKTGALIGLAWILITALLGIIAPYIASSYPITWQVQNEAGQWVRQWPMFAYLTPLDAMLTVGLILLVVLGVCYKAGGKLVWVWLMPVCVTVVCALLFHLISDHRQLVIDYRNESIALSALIRWWMIWSLAGIALAGLVTLSVMKLKQHPRWLGVASLFVVMIAGLLLSPGLRVEPRPNFAYDTARAMLAEGKAKDAVFTLIPYSPDDLQLDAPVKVTLRPPGPSPSEADIVADMQSQMEHLYGIRLYSLDQAAGDDTVTPDPATFDEAYAAADRLWTVYQQRGKAQSQQRGETYDADQASQENAQIRAELDALAASEIGKRNHIMGTTSSGQDLTSRMIHGARIALIIGFISTGIAVLIGVIVGGVLGYFAGWVDLIGLRFVEVFASIPVIMLLIMIVAFYGRSLILMMVVLGLTGWVGYAYFIRAEFLKLRKMDYVMAARAAGTPLHLILFRHMLPNGVAPILVAASFGIAGAIMTEATLSFLGLGLENEPSWGQMLNQAREGGSFSWWLAIFPGAAIFLTVFAYNLIGEALRDVIDPKAVE